MLIASRFLDATVNAMIRVVLNKGAEWNERWMMILKREVEMTLMERKFFLQGNEQETREGNSTTSSSITIPICTFVNFHLHETFDILC